MKILNELKTKGVPYSFLKQYPEFALTIKKVRFVAACWCALSPGFDKYYSVCFLSHWKIGFVLSAGKESKSWIIP